MCLRDNLYCKEDKMDILQKILNQAILPRFDYQIGKVSFAPSYLQAGAIVFLLFLLVLTFARLRRLYVHWSLKGAFSMIFLGFLLAIVIEGFMIIGGRTMFTEILGWKNPPKPISHALDLGREKLVDVLGITDEIPSSNAQEKVSKEIIMEAIRNLSPNDSEEVKEVICNP